MVGNLHRQSFSTLQLLRGIAAIAVVFFHEFGSSSIFVLGKHGVDLFFVLSGFIIFYIHSNDIGDKRKVFPFLTKRLTRIFPIYWLITIIYIVLVAVFSNSAISFKYIINSLLLLPQAQDPIIGAAWTLEYEILFYLIFCVLMLSRKVFYPAMALWGISIILLFIFPDVLITSKSIIINPSNLEFLFGCVLAYVVLKNNFNFKWTLHLGIIGILVSSILQYYNVTANHVVAWGIPFSLLILGLVKLEINKKINLPRTLTYLGDASYSIYLTHLVTILVLESIIEKLNLFEQYGHNGLVQFSIVVVAVIVGCIFYSLVEKPLLKYTKSLISKSNGRKSQRYNYAIDLD